MPREKESYRDNLERLCQAFPNKEMLTVKDASNFLGVDMRTTKKLLVFKNNYISKASLARAIST